MPITNFWASSPSLTSLQQGWVTPGAADFNKAPADLDPDVFRTWTRDQQVSYINAKGGGPIEIGQPPNSVTASIAATKALQLFLPNPGVPSLPGETFAVEGPGREATATEFAMAPDALDPMTFLAWRREDQIAYLAQQGSPAVIGGASDPRKVFASLVPDVALGSGVIQPPLGGYEPIPYYHMDGSAAGTPSPIVQASAEALFPTLDGEDVKLGVEDRPAEFYTTPAMLNSGTTAEKDAKKTAFLRSFATWHSAYQLEYIKKHTTNGVLDITVDGPPSTRMTAVVSSSDETKLFIVQSLDKNAFSRMTLVEQNQIAGTGAFAELATRLGLTSVSAATVPSVVSGGQKTAQAAADELTKYINEKFASYKDILEETVPPPAGVDGIVGDMMVTYAPALFPPGYFTKRSAPRMPQADREAFTGQLDVLTAQLTTMGVVSPADINKKLATLKERFDRAFAFWDVKPPTETTVDMEPGDDDPVIVPTYTDVISLDGDLSGINRGYQIFMAQERRIAELAKQRMDIATTFSGKQLDVPTLVYKFQSLYNLSLEAEVVMETEDINQQNDLLKTYAAMQDLVNKVLSTFEKADSDKRTIDGNTDDANGYARMSDADRKLISMFEDVQGAGQGHPLEKLRNLGRPLHDIIRQEEVIDSPFPGIPDYVAERFEFNKFSHTQWSTFGTRLSEKVTLINQNSQIKMNDVNSLDKQRNRHFELANNALSKMAEMIQSIGRA
jgi:hypothetical protein